MDAVRRFLLFAVIGVSGISTPPLYAAESAPPARSVETPQPPTIVLAPQNYTRIGGPDVVIVLTIAATGAAPLSFQWYRDGTPVPGAIGERLTVALPAVSNEEPHAYQVVVSNPIGSVSSTAAIVTTLPPDHTGSAHH